MKNTTKTLTFLSIMALALCIMPGCKKSSNAPSACIASIPASVRIDTTLAFTTCSTPSSSTTYTWNFGDGQTSTVNPATHAYTTPGTYTITLTATNTNGTSTQTTTITITAPSAMVKTEILSTQGVSTVNTYTYDNQGRVTSIQTQGGSTQTFTYTANGFAYSSGSTNYTATYNSNGLVASRSDGTVYTYDNNGYNLTQVNTSAGSSTTNTITNGNIVSSVQATNGTTTTSTYTYSTALDFRNYGASFYGKTNTNLWQTVNNSAGGSFSATYIYDSYGRVNIATIISSGVTYTITDNYY